MKVLLQTFFRWPTAVIGSICLLLLSGCESKNLKGEKQILLLRKENKDLFEKNKELSKQIQKVLQEVSEQEHFLSQEAGRKVTLSKLESELEMLQSLIDEKKSEPDRIKTYSEGVITDTKRLIALSEEELSELDPLEAKGVSIDTYQSMNKALTRAESFQHRLVEENEKLRAQLKERKQ